MTSQELQDILDKVWMRDWSADDAHRAIFGEPFDGYTNYIHGTNSKDAPPIRIRTTGCTYPYEK